MTRTITRAKTLSWVEKFVQFATIKSETDLATKRQNALKKELMDQIDGEGEADEKGSKYLEFPAPVEVAGAVFSGLKRERRVSIKFDEDRAEELLREKGIYDKATTTITQTYLDQDKIYVLQQEGHLDEDELDSLFSESVSYAFIPLKS